MHSLCPPSTVTRPILAQAFSLPNHAVHLQNHPRNFQVLNGSEYQKLTWVDV